MEPQQIYIVTEDDATMSLITLKGETIEMEEQEVIEEPQTTATARPKKMRISEQQQERMLELQGEGKSVMQISQEMGIKRTTVHEVLKRTNKMVRTNILKLRRMKKKRRKKNKKAELLSDDQVDMINEWLDEDSLMSMQKICDRLKDICGVTVSKSFISKIIDDFHYSIKRVDIDPYQTVRQDKNLVAARQEYAQAFIELHRDHCEEQIVFVHFASFNLTVRASSECPNERSSKRTLFNSVGCAMTKAKIIQYSFQFLAWEYNDYLDFYTKLVNKMRNAEGMEKAVIVLDETVLGDIKEDVANIIKSEEYQILNLPTDSVFLNPIERLFTGWKKVTKRLDISDERSLLKALECADEKLLTTEDCEGCYFSALSHIMHCYHGKWYDPEVKVASFRPLKE